MSSGGPRKGSAGHRPVLGVRRDPRRSPAERTKAFDAAPATVPQRRVIGTATSPLGHDLGPQTSGLPAFRSARLKCRYPARSGCPRFAVLGKRPCVEHPKGMDGSHFTRGACQTAGPCIRAGAACTVYCPVRLAVLRRALAVSVSMLAAEIPPAGTRRCLTTPQFVSLSNGDDRSAARCHIKTRMDMLTWVRLPPTGCENWKPLFLRNPCTNTTKSTKRSSGKF